MYAQKVLNSTTHVFGIVLDISQDATNPKRGNWDTSRVINFVIFLLLLPLDLVILVCCKLILRLTKNIRLL
jgi:hypothetical protein